MTSVHGPNVTSQREKGVTPLALSVLAATIHHTVISFVGIAFVCDLSLNTLIFTSSSSQPGFAPAHWFACFLPTLLTLYLLLCLCLISHLFTLLSSLFTTSMLTTFHLQHARCCCGFFHVIICSLWPPFSSSLFFFILLSHTCVSRSARPSSRYSKSAVQKSKTGLA